MPGFGYTRLRKIINSIKICSVYDADSVTHNFQESPSNNCSIYEAEISYSQFLGLLKRNFLYAILGLHGAFRNVTSRITENSLYVYIYIYIQY